MIQGAGPGCLAGEDLLAVPVQADDSVVEYGVSGLLPHLVRTNLTMQRKDANRDSGQFLF